MPFRFETTYIVKNGDDLGSATYWNVRLKDIDVRLNNVETFTSVINKAADDVTAAGIARINDTLTPLMNTLVADVNTLEATVASLQNTVITDQSSVIGQLNTLLATAQTLIANLQSLGTIDGGTF